MLAIFGAISGGYDVFECESFKVDKVGRILIVSEEDGLGVLQNRLEALVRGHGWDQQLVLSNVYFIAQEGASLDDPAWRAHIISEAQRINASHVVLDPYTELTSAEENSNTEAKPLIRYLRKITKEADVSVTVIHHFGQASDGKQGIHRIRGNTALKSAARVIWCLTETAIGVSMECVKMSRSEKPKKFTVKREIQSDPTNRALWETARFTYASQTEAENEAAERFVIGQLTQKGSLNTTELKDLAKGTGVSGVGVSGAIRDLSAIGKIGYEKGPNNSKKWHFLPIAQESRQPRQPDLPGCPELARQPESAAPVVAPTGGRATGANPDGQAGNPDGLPLDDYEQAEREGMQEESQ